MLAKIEIIDKPTDIDDEMRFTFEPAITSGNDVLTVTDLSKQFDGDVLFSGIGFEIKRGERVAIIGDNGTGKTTLLKIINGLLPPDAGEVRIGAKVNIGYYDQEQQNLEMDNTVFEEISDEYPEMNNTQIRSVLAAFLFTGEDVFKRIRDLSGGERGRVALAKLMLSEANFLILDEPTNHLDITSREVLENALNGYAGTVLCVSHDRYFINRTATRILDLTMGTVLNYIGNYDYYLEKKDVTEKAYLESSARIPAGQPESSGESGAFSPSAGAAVREDSGKLSWQQQKEIQAKQRKLQNDLKKTEDEIHRLETRDQEIDELLALEENYSDVDKLVKLNDAKHGIASRLETLYEQWEQLAELNES